MKQESIKDSERLNAVKNQMDGSDKHPFIYSHYMHIYNTSILEMH
jgi:hypothetical protein